jgi:Zn-dependent protease
MSSSPWQGRSGPALCDHRGVFGGRSIRLAEVFGIRIGVDPSWFIVLFLIIWFLSGDYGVLYPDAEITAYVLAAASALLFFTSVVLHELGHALVAIRNGIGISGIDLWLFGGVAKLRRDSSSALVEFKVAAAGPLVSLAITVVCGAVAFALDGREAFWLLLFAGPSPAPLGALFGYLAVINAALLVFNLLPGFPLDGGRIARAIVWWRTGDRARATRVAARLGRFFSYVLIGLGLYLILLSDFGGIWLALIGLFLGQAARASEVQARVQAQIEGITVADVMDAQPVAVSLTMPLDRVYEEFFLRYGWPWFPVVDASGRFLGLVTRESVEAVDEEQRASMSVDDVIARDPEGSLRAGLDESIEAFLDSHRDGLARLGAVMAVDAEGVLRGVVTLQQLQRVLRPVNPAG